MMAVARADSGQDFTFVFHASFVIIISMESKSKSKKKEFKIINPR